MANQQLRDQVEAYKSSLQKNRRLKRIAFMVALCLVAVTIVALVLPAVTLEYGKASCGKEEHVHAEACVNRSVVCGLPEVQAGHVHTPSCYDELGALVCGKSAVGHMHLDECVNADATALVCGQEETVHMHTAGCIDPVTNTYRCDNADVAHVHGETCYALQNGAYVLVCQEPSVGHVHTAICLDPATGEVACGLAEAIEITHSHDDSCYQEELICGLEEHTHTDLCYDEITQSIMKNEEKKAEEAEKVAEVEGIPVDGSSLGESGLTANEITEAVDQGLLFENDDMIIVFEVPEKISDSIKLEVAESDEAIAFFEAEDERVDESAESTEGIVVEYDTDDATAAAEAVAAEAAKLAAEKASTQAAVDEPAFRANVHIDATLDGKPVNDISKLGITAKLQLKPTVIAPILSTIDYSTVAADLKDQVGAQITILQNVSGAETYALSERGDDQILTFVASQGDVSPVATFDLVSENIEAISDATANPTFTVSYYGYVDTWLTYEEATNDDNKFKFGGADNIRSIEMIDTDGKGVPTSSNSNPTIQMGLYESDGKWLPTIETLDEKIYADKTFSYFESYSVSSVNALVDQSDTYRLDRVIVRNGDIEQTYPIDDNREIFFTDNPDNDQDNCILISDGATVELHYASREKDSSFDATLYDYDITETIYYDTNAKEGTVNTATERGINVSDNYTGLGAKFAFGDKDPQTGLQDQTFNGRMINVSNWDGLGAFGLADPDITYNNGIIRYSNGLLVPNLFDDDNGMPVLGKTTYADSNLTFAQVGNTYTLVSASNGEGADVSGLDRFQSIFNMSIPGEVFTNNFWAVDETPSHGGVENGISHDTRYQGNLHFGSGSLPGALDNGVHNAYFGMQYAVDFTLPADYVGPLNYYFYGNDDMWVYLDGKLVGDLGGVHASYGQYINLWDYISGTSGNHQGDGQIHTLKFYFTERGAVDSTCFMRFTLPVVSSVQPVDYASLKLEKQIMGSGFTDADTFHFNIQLLDASGSSLSGDFPCETHLKDGSVIEGQFDAAEGTYDLAAGAYVVIKDLPEGTQYLIDEPYWDQDKKITVNGTAVSEAVARNVLVAGKTDEVVFTNMRLYALPATGGIGAEWYAFSGGMLVLFAIIALRRKSVVSATPSTRVATKRNIYASPSGKPESTYAKGRHHAWRGDGQTRKGGIH